MIDTKYNIGDKVYIEYTVDKITVTHSHHIAYTLERTDAPKVKTTTGRFSVDPDDYLNVSEGQLSDIECIPVSQYEDEINDLKEEIERLRNMYAYSGDTTMGNIDLQRVAASAIGHIVEKDE